MSRRWKIAGGMAAAVALLTMVTIACGIYIAKSEWLREKVRERIVSTLELASGGRVQVTRFQFDWATLTAEVDDLFIHGSEPADGPPLLRVPKLVVGLKIISLMEQSVDVSLVRMEKPQVYLLIAADGSTNIPRPKIPQKGGKSAAETILDLKIGEFALIGAGAEIHAAGQPRRAVSYDFSGKQLQSKVAYNRSTPSYRGSLSIDPLRIRYGDGAPSEVHVSLNLVLERNRLLVSDVKLGTAVSRVQFEGMMDGFSAPVFTARFNGEFSLAELHSFLKAKPAMFGNVAVSGEARFVTTADYSVTGQANSRNFGVQQDMVKISNIRADSDFQLGPETLDFKKLRATVLGGTISGYGKIRRFDQFEMSGQVKDFDAATIAALGTTAKLPYGALISGPVSVRGRFFDRDLRNFAASGRLTISPSAAGLPVTGELDAQYDGAAGEFLLNDSHVTLPHTRLDSSGALGRRMQVTLQTQNLDEMLPVLSYWNQKTFPVTLRQGTDPGSIRFEGIVTGPLAAPRIDGHIVGRNVIYSEQTVTEIAGDIAALPTGLSVRNATMVYNNIRAAFQGSVGLIDWKVGNDRPVTGSATLQNASVTDLLRLAGYRNLPVTGTLSESTQVSGTVGNLQVAANLTITNGSAYEEPFDRLTGKLEFQADGTETAVVQWRSGPRQVNVNARYRHISNDLRTGQLHFELATNQIALAQVAHIHKWQPSANGNAAATAKGDITLTKGVPKISALNTDANGTALTLNGHPLGNARLLAHADGQTITAHLDSNFAQAQVKGDGSWRMIGDYPGTAEITFAQVDLATVRRTFSPPQSGRSMDFTGSTAGKVSVNGPLLKPEALTGLLEIPQLEIRPGTVTALALAKEISDATLQSTEPIRISLADSIVRVESARFRALNTDLALLGSIDLKQKGTLNLNLNGRADLHLLRTFNSDLESSGTLAIRVTVRGSLDEPKLGGTADLRNGNFSMVGFPNGLTAANGRITFDENRANLENLNAVTGGGTIRLVGFAAFSGPLVSFRLEGVAKSVRIRYPEGVSSVSDADLTWTGTTERSVLGGEVTVQKVTYNPQSDLSSILSLSANPATVGAAPTGILAGVQFDVKVQTAPGITFQTGLVTGLETVANLRLKGTPSNPALLGRITVNSGSIVFLGNKYVINQGTISFFNPVKIDPVLNLDLETQARGVTVTLSVAGPISKLNVTYQSDPPLQFNDIVGLLATGKAPSDPTIAARQGDTSQSWTQIGATALVGQAIGNPVAGRLQRFLGVSRLKIDPLLPGLGGAGSGTVGAGAGARLSLEQQITPNILFDYVISTNSTNSQIVRVEWAFSKSWSAVIIREENSAFGIDFQYKKRFK